MKIPYIPWVQFANITTVNLGTFRTLGKRDWLAISLRALAIVFVVMVAVWTGRYAWTVYGLNRGVGDTVFYDAAGRPWFRLDEQRRDVPLERISTYVKDAGIAVEDHR